MLRKSSNKKKTACTEPANEWITKRLTDLANNCGNNDRKWSYLKAITSVRQYPIEITTAREAEMLKGIGPVLAREIMLGRPAVKPHSTTASVNDPSVSTSAPQLPDVDDDNNNSYPDTESELFTESQSVKTVTLKRPRVDDRYLPEKAKGPWSILLCLYRLGGSGCKICKKTEVVEVAATLTKEGLSIAPLENCWQSALKALKTKGLITSAKSVTSLTAEGIQVAENILDSLGLSWTKVVAEPIISVSVVPCTSTQMLKIDCTIDDDDVDDENDGRSYESVGTDAADPFNAPIMDNNNSNNNNGSSGARFVLSLLSDEETDEYTTNNNNEDVHSTFLDGIQENAAKDDDEQVCIHQCSITHTLSPERSVRPCERPSPAELQPTNPLVLSSSMSSYVSSTSASASVYISDSNSQSTSSLVYRKMDATRAHDVIDLTQGADDDDNDVDSDTDEVNCEEDDSIFSNNNAIESDYSAPFHMYESMYNYNDLLELDSTSNSRCSNTSSSSFMKPSSLSSQGSEMQPQSQSQSLSLSQTQSTHASLLSQSQANSQTLLSQVLSKKPVRVPDMKKYSLTDEDADAGGDDFALYVASSYSQDGPYVSSSSSSQQPRDKEAATAISSKQSSISTQNEHVRVHNNEVSRHVVQKKISDFIPTSTSSTTIQQHVVEVTDGKIEVDYKTADIILVVDMREKKDVRETVLGKMLSEGLMCEVGTLAVADFAWVARPKAGNKKVQDVIIECLAERKTNDDLCSSILDGRYLEQKRRLRDCGLRTKLYLIEGKLVGSVRGNVTAAALHTAIATIQVGAGISVLHTRNLDHTVANLVYLHRQVVRRFRSGSSGSRFLPLTEFNRRNTKLKASTAGELFAMQLKQVPGIAAAGAEALALKYGTLPTFLAAFRGTDESATIKELASLQRRGGAGKKIGPTTAAFLWKWLSQKSV